MSDLLALAADDERAPEPPEHWFAEFMGGLGVVLILFLIAERLTRGDPTSHSCFDLIKTWLRSPL